MFCPECKISWEEETGNCPVCGHVLKKSNANEETRWVRLGYIDDKVSADFAVEVLKTYDIQAVVISKSGFFGNVGLTLNPIYSDQSARFEVSVPADSVEEAIDLLDMALGDKWQRRK